MSAIIMFRSLTRAQRGVQALAAGGIPATVIRPPLALSERGCAFAVGVAKKRLAAALETLDREGISHEKAFLPAPDGTYREAVL